MKNFCIRKRYVKEVMACEVSAAFEELALFMCVFFEIFFNALS